MKKLLTSLTALAAIFAGTVAFAQEPVQEQEQEQNLLEEVQQAAKPYKVYCEIVATPKFFSNKATVEFDFGQYANFWSSDRQLVDEQGKSIDFNSALDAANYMARRGWDLEEVFIVQNMTKGDSGTTHYHWVMSKMVTDDFQITEGLRTRGMTK